MRSKYRRRGITIASAKILQWLTERNDFFRIEITVIRIMLLDLPQPRYVIVGMEN